MTRKFKVWLDSGANHASCRETEITLDELGFSSEGWDALSDEEKDDAMRDIAFESSDWGFREITDETE